ncbi:hypothetical protein IMSAGC019_03164 [Lachnospiraceae bacterium]|nr:hypothetical protein IMSAGC019_03164 [Lachnospiraceae bacterium]
MSRKIEIVKNALAEMANFLVLFALGVVVWGDFIETPPDFGILLALGLVPLFYYGARERCESFWVFLLLHLLPWGGFCLLDKAIAEKALLFFLLAAITLMSFSRKMKGLAAGMEAAHPAFAALVFWGLYLIDGRFGGGAWSGFLLYVGTGFAVGYLLRYFFQQFLHFMDVNNRTTENIPVKHVFRSAMALAGGFTAIAGSLMVFGAHKGLADTIGAALIRVLAAVFRFLFSMLPGAGEKEPVFEEAAGAAGEGFGELMEPGEPSLLAQIFEILFEALVAAALIALAVTALLAAVRLIREIFSRKGKSPAKEEGAFEDKVENLERGKRKQKEKPEGSLWERMGKALSPEERIRRIYRKVLEKERASLKEEEWAVLATKATPRECCAALFPEEGDLAQEFARLYEKARYGRGLCGGEDVKKARKLADGLHR